MKNKRIGVDKANGAVTLQTRDCELIFLVSHLFPVPRLPTTVDRGVFCLSGRLAKS